MKIKVVVDKSNKNEYKYAVYHGFTRPCLLNPLYTHWILDRKGMTAEELGKYLSNYMDEECIIKFPFGSYHNRIWKKNYREYINSLCDTE